ncbi:MAG TPA: hypothetical protein VJN18_13225 [Polyangiaceae bacterium]|nr:hypothetical protein [Polyangiaceae bacterium]
MQLPIRHLLAGVCVLLAGLAAFPRESHATASADVAWAVLAGGRVVSWEVKGGVNHLRHVDLASSVALSPGELLLVPVDPGDVLCAVGQVALGLGSGTADVPDTITWWPAAARDIRVPTWSSARFLVVQVTSPASTPVQLFVARAVIDPLAWHRLDDAVSGWLFDARPLTQAPPAQAATALRHVQALERLLAGVDRSVRAPWLMARWLDLSLRVRPLSSPYFARSSPAPSGGALSPPTPGRGASPEYRDLQAGEDLVFSDADSDVIRLELHANNSATARIAVFEGDTLARVVELAVRRVGTELATSRSVRAIVPVGTGQVRVRMLEGSARVGFEGFAMRRSVLDALGAKHDRARNLARLRSSPPGAGPEWLRRLVDAQSLATRASCERLSLSNVLEPGTSALLELERARCASSLEATLRSAVAYRRRHGSLPKSARAALERAVLQRLLDVDASRLDLDSAPSDADAPEDRAVSGALAAALSRAPSPHALEGAETASARFADRPDLVQVARRAWLRGTLWSALQPRLPHTTLLKAVIPTADPDSPGSCTVQAGGMPRWTMLDSARKDVLVGPSDGTHSHVLLRLAPGVERELNVKIGGVPVTVHAAAGLMGHVALTPGTHRFEMEQGVQLLARLPREGRAPCSELRELERWALVRPQAQFDVAPGDVGRPARLTVDRASLAGHARELQILSGADRYTAWVRPPATGAIELPRAGSTSIEVRSEAALWMRASLRQPLKVAPVARLATHRAPSTSDSEQLLLDRLRRATRKLNAASDAAARSSAHLERADILGELGARRLSDLERQRASIAPLAGELREPGPTLALRFPRHTPDVVVLGVASQIPPLAPAAHAETLRHARRLDEAHQPPALIAEALASSAASSSGADALLLAQAAEQAGLPGVAAAAYERIARATQSGAAFARAATLLADSAAQLSDRQLALRAYLLARRATEQGDTALDALSRLAPAVSWLSASSAASGSGSLPLVHLGRPGIEPLGVRIRRALLDADAAAVLLGDDRRLELNTDHAEPREVNLHITCLALKQSGSCQASLELDGKKVPCAGLETSEASSEARCRVTVPAGRHRVDITPDPAREMVMAALVTSGQEVIQPRVVSTWTEVDRAHPLKMRVYGPTVLRIMSRAQANAEQRITLELTSRTTSERRVWEIPSSADGAVSRLGNRSAEDPELGAQNEHFWLIEEAGEQQLSLAPESGPALVRLQAAFASGIPAARTPAQAAIAPTLALASPAPSAPPALAVHQDKAAGPLTLNATISLERSDFSDSEGDTPHVHEELRVAALRELRPSQAYVSAGLIYRMRSGVDSRGAFAAASSSPNGVLPGTFARGLVMQQALPAGVATGWHGTLGLLWEVPLSKNAALMPWVDVAGRRAASLTEVAPDVDSDVYSRYARRQPVSLSSGLRFDTRPFLDTLARYGIAARYAPRDAVLDRADVLLSLDTLPGSGLFPWLAIWGSASYRPMNVIRNSAFTRTTLGAQLNFFGWFRQSERWLLFGQVVHFVDWPAAAPTTSFSIGVSVDETFGRGLRDYAPRNVPFRDRLEEGSARVQRRGPARERAWEQQP